MIERGDAGAFGNPGEIDHNIVQDMCEKDGELWLARTEVVSIYIITKIRP